MTAPVCTCYVELQYFNQSEEMKILTQRPLEYIKAFMYYDENS